MAELHARTADAMLRRTKAECLSLPPKRRRVQTVDVTPQQQRAYEELVRTASASLDRALKVAPGFARACSVVQLRQSESREAVRQSNDALQRDAARPSCALQQLLAAAECGEVALLGDRQKRIRERIIVVLHARTYANTRSHAHPFTRGCQGRGCHARVRSYGAWPKYRVI